MPATLDEGKVEWTVHLAGEVTIACAAELKKLLIQALASKKELRVDVQQATQLDVTALQLLWVLAHEARASETKLELVGRVPDEISAAVVDAGFDKFPIAMDPGLKGA